MMTLEQQLAAACTVYPYEASRILDVYIPGNLNGVPDREWFAERFTFSADQLREYILEDPMRAGDLIKSLAGSTWHTFRLCCGNHGWPL